MATQSVADIYKKAQAMLASAQANLNANKSSSSSSSSKTSSSSSSSSSKAPATTASTPGVAGTGYWSNTGWVQGGSSANDPTYAKLTSQGQTYGVGGTASSSSGSSSSVNTTPQSMGSTYKAPTSTPQTSSYTGGSVVDYLSSIGKPTDFNSRAAQAKQLGIANYTGTAAQNNQLLSMLRSSPASTSTPTQSTQTPASTSFSPQGGTVEWKTYKGVDYAVTGDPVTDKMNLEQAKEEARRMQEAEREQTIADQKKYDNQGLIQQLIDLQRRTYEQASPHISNLAMLKSKNAQQIANTLGSSGDESLQTGRAGIYQQLAAQQEGVRQAEIDNILQNATTSAGMLGTGITATMPQMQFGQLTNPQSGQVIGAGASGNNPALDAAVERAVLIAKSGGGDSAALSTLSGFGQAGVNAYVAAMQKEGGYNPTVLNAQASAGANLSTAGTMGNAQSIQGITQQINDIQSVLPAAQANIDRLINIGKQGGQINTQLPILNELMQAVSKNLYSSNAMAAFKTQLEQVVAQYSQLTGQTLIPDQVTMGQLESIKNTLNQTVNSNLTALTQKRNQLMNSGASGGSVNPYTSSGTSGGGLFNW